MIPKPETGRKRYTNDGEVRRLLPPGRDAGPSQGYPPAVRRRYPFYTPGWRETMWDKVSGLRKQHDGRKAMKFACYQRPT